MGWAVPFEIRAALTVECAACPSPPARVTILDLLLPRGSSLPVPSLPRGWRVLDGQLVCDQHTITITVAARSRAAAAGERACSP